VIDEANGHAACLIAIASPRITFSWTKVNRSLTEGRRRFLDRFGELSTGQRCAEVQELLSTACDGEASPEQERTLRAHLAGCGSCRAALRSFRAAPRQVAELFPPGIVVGLAQQQSWLARLGDWLSVNSGDRAGALAWKVQQSAEALGAQKAAAVVASTAALAGGTAVQEHRAHDHPAAKRTARVEHAPSTTAPQATPVPAAAAPPVQPIPAAVSDRASDRAAEAKDAPTEEFAPSPAGAPASAPEARVTTASGGGEFSGPGSGSGSGGRGGGEFGP
jgi:hypothetical protein